jgi:hypothetical protein
MHSGIRNFINVGGNDNKNQKEVCVTCKFLGKSSDVCSILPGHSINCSVCNGPAHRSHRSLFSTEPYICSSCQQNQLNWTMQRTSGTLTKKEVDMIFAKIFGVDK